MNTLDTVNAFLTSQHYQDQAVGSKHALRLRSGKTFSDLSEQSTYQLWNDLAVRAGNAVMDVHRFTALNRRLYEILSCRIGVCETCSDPGVWDPWSRTGGGVPTEAQTPPICDQHAERLTNEYSGELAGLFRELEHAACEFTHHSIDTQVHQAIEETLKPFLIKNLATRYCEECERTIHNQTDQRGCVS